MGELATSADVIAYLERLKTNAEKVADNSAAGPEAQLQATHWYDLLCWLLDQAEDHSDEDLADKLVHWARLLERITGELRVGLHLGESASDRAPAAQRAGDEACMSGWSE